MRRAEREQRQAAAATNTSSALANIFGGSKCVICQYTVFPFSLFDLFVAAQSTSTHIATDHEDTTEGAVHCFQDEFGNWHSYTFGTDSSGTASNVNRSQQQTASAGGNTNPNNLRVISNVFQQSEDSLDWKANESRYAPCVSPI